MIAPYAVPRNGATLKDNNTELDGGQDNGESSDAAQQHDTTPGTASAVFNSLGYAMAGETKTPILWLTIESTYIFTLIIKS